MHPARDADSTAGAAGGHAWVELGRVRRTHGQDGSLVVGLFGDDPDTLVDARAVMLSGRSASIEFQVRDCEPLGEFKGHPQVRLWLEGLEDRSAAELWSGARVHVSESELPVLPEGEYYWRELIGASCRLKDGTLLGRIDEIWPTGANDVLVVRGQGEAVLVPALDDVLLRLDREANELWVDLPPGFFEPEDR